MTDLFWIAQAVLSYGLTDFQGVVCVSLYSWVYMGSYANRGLKVRKSVILVLLLRSKDDYARAVARKQAADRARRLEKGGPR